MGLIAPRRHVIATAPGLLVHNFRDQQQRLRVNPQSQNLGTMKRKEASVKVTTPAKKARVAVPEYHLSPCVKEQDGSITWPAPRTQMEKAREIILAW